MSATGGLCFNVKLQTPVEPGAAFLSSSFPPKNKDVTLISAPSKTGITCRREDAL